MESAEQFEVIYISVFMVAKYTPIMAVRKYKTFRGNNRFCCHGYLISAQNIGIMVFVAILLVLVSGLFFAFE